MLARDHGRQTDPDQDSLRDGPEHDNEGEVMQMKNHEKAAAIADKLRNIRLEVIVTAEDVLLKCLDDAELDFYYRYLCR